MSEKKYITTAAGAPVTDNTNILTAGPSPLLQDVWYLEKLAF